MSREMPRRIFWYLLVLLILAFISALSMGVRHTLLIVDADVQNQTWAEGFFLMVSVAFAMLVALVTYKS